MKIYVGNLDFEVMDDFLRAAFEQFGQVDSAVIAREHNSSDSKGYAFVDMPVEDEARAAIAGLNGKELMGRAIEVQDGPPPQEVRKTGSGNSLFAPEPRPQQEHVRRPASRPDRNRGSKPGLRNRSKDGSRLSIRRRSY